MNTIPESNQLSQTYTMRKNNLLTLNLTPRSQSLQSLPILSPNRRPTPTGLPKQLGMLTITRYTSHLTAYNGSEASSTLNTQTTSQQLQISPAVSETYDIEDYYDEDQGQGPYALDDESEFYSPKDRDVYYDLEVDNVPVHGKENLPPVPTYSESQMAYYPHGIKRLPHFHPQKFSRRLRTLMDQRRKPRPLYLDVEPNTKILLNTPLLPEHQQLQSPTAFNFINAIVRMLGGSGQSYRKVRQQDEVERGVSVVEYADEDVEREEVWWRGVDQRVVLIGLIGLLVLGLSIAAWTVAVLRA